MKRAALLCALLIAARALADDGRYQEYPVGSRAMALGGAFAALGDDPSGLFYNPAGVCDTHRINVSVSASLYGIEKVSQGAIQLNAGSFSLATLNVIPGEAGLLKGFGPIEGRGVPLALGFDVSVPSFRSYGTDQTESFGALTRQLHQRVLDRTFVLAAGGAYRLDEHWSFGAALHYRLRLFEQTEDQLVSGSGPDPAVGVYHAAASFQNGDLVALLGAKLRLDHERWTLGASLGLPGLELHSDGKVDVQDVVSDPSRPPGQRTTVTVYNATDQVNTHTPSPFTMRAAVARIEPRSWTLTGQLTFYAGTSYDRFNVPEPIASRLRIQDHVDRRPVLNLNLGGELLITPEYSAAFGLFTDNSGAQPLDADANGVLRPGSSRLQHLNLYGGTATFGVIGQHSISRVGMTVSYGSGEDAVVDETAGLDSNTYRRAQVHQLFLYVFLASTFRY